MSIIEKVKTIIEIYGQNDQRTDGWHTKRGQMLTASEIYKALPDATPAQRHELIMSKLTPKQISTGPGSNALIWGTRFEPIAKDIYKHLEGNIDIVDTTCIPHPVHSFLGASPDGILLTDDYEDKRYGKLVEFKCPISRKFTDSTPIPPAYYHQMQLQMECTGLDECDYVEMEFKNVFYNEWLDSTAQYKSFFVLHDDTGEIIYKHFDDPRSSSVWRDEELKENQEHYQTIYWVLANWRKVHVPKQQDWLEKNLSSFQSVWNEVQEFRNSGTLPPHPKEKTTLML